MSDLNGVDLNSLQMEAPSCVPNMVPGRVLQLDGDMLCYECAGNDDDPFNMCTTNFAAALDSRRQLAGAEFVNIHLTGGDKGGRFDLAMVKEYQGNRKNKVKPKNLAPLRAWVMEKYKTKELGHVWNSRFHENQEADDGMAQEQFKAISEGRRELSIIMSGDKDLGMCSGLHCDWVSFQIEDVHGFGSCILDRSGSTTKVRGKGTSFFWHQLLMGDTADSIPGLPMLGGDMLNKYKPTKASADALAVLENPASDQKLRAKAHGVLAARKPGLIGPALAFDVLKDCKDDKECFLRVVEAYQSHYGTQPFEMECWRGDKHTFTSGHMLMEQARLLWMRRVPGECPSTFFKQVMEGKLWDGSSKFAIKEAA